MTRVTTQVRRSCLGVLGVLAGIAVFVSAPSGQAGDFAFEVRFTNMTPDAYSGDEAKKCSDKIRGGLIHQGANVQFMSETPLRKAVGAEDKSKSFMDWTVEQVVPSLKKAPQVTLLAVDCRPKEKYLDVLLINELTDSKVTIRMRNQEISMRRLNWFIKDALEHAFASHR